MYNIIRRGRINDKVKIIKNFHDYCRRGYEVTLFLEEKEIWEVSRSKMNYWDLNREEKWMESDDSPYVIGGRDTDISQIAFTLMDRVKQLYPINEVPAEIALQLVKLRIICGDCEKEIKNIISFISDYRKKHKEK